MKIRATFRESSVRPSFHVSWWLLIVSKNTFSVISNSLPSQFMKDLCWKQVLLRIFVLSFTANILMFSNLPKKLNLPSGCSKPGQQLDNSVCGELNMGQIWFMIDLKMIRSVVIGATTAWRWKFWGCRHFCQCSGVLRGLHKYLLKLQKASQQGILSNQYLSALNDLFTSAWSKGSCISMKILNSCGWVKL